MANPQYPHDKLPIPVRDNYADTYGIKMRRFQMDDGHSRARRMWGQQPDSITLLWRLTWDQYAIWTAFLVYRVSNGADPFDMKLTEAGPYETIQFSTPPSDQFNAANNSWEISATVSIVRAAPSGGAPASMPEWPASLPAPEKDGYGITTPNSFARGNIEDGMPQQRARQKELIGVVTMKWLLDPTQYATAKNFIHNSLMGGLLPFNGWFSNGKGPMQRVRMAFTENPKFAVQDAWFSLSGTLEVRDLPVISKLELIGNTETIQDEITTSDTLSAKFNNYANDYVDWGYTSDTKHLA